jgi:hypothetical protein
MIGLRINCVRCNEWNCIMAIKDFDIADLPQLDNVPAAHGALSSQTQLGGPNLFDIIITIVIATGGK